MDNPFTVGGLNRGDFFKENNMDYNAEQVDEAFEKVTGFLDVAYGFVIDTVDSVFATVDKAVHEAYADLRAPVSENDEPVQKEETFSDLFNKHFRTQ